jgi:hypothetical protein
LKGLHDDWCAVPRAHGRLGNSGPGFNLVSGVTILDKLGKVEIRSKVPTELDRAVRFNKYARRHNALSNMSYYWRFFNFAVRCVGVGFVVAGVLLTHTGWTLIDDPKATLNVNGVPSSDPWIKGMPLVLGLVVGVLGVLLVFARSFRPDLESSDEKDDEVSESPETFKARFDDARRFWEPRRTIYNLILTAVVVLSFLKWPHFRPGMTLQSLKPFLLLWTIANVCYSIAYLPDILLQSSLFCEFRQRRRWILWLVGTLFAVLLVCYWIYSHV